MSVVVRLYFVSEELHSTGQGYLDSLGYSLGKGISISLKSIPCKENTVADIPYLGSISGIDSVGPIGESSVASHDNEICPCNG